MVKHPDLAKGVLKVPDAKTKSKQLWERLTEDLNAVSSPIRDIDGWKNVWADFKNNIETKCRCNRNSISGTGGGPSKFCSLTVLEEKVVDLLSIDEAVKGMAGTPSFGVRPSTISNSVPIINVDLNVIKADNENGSQIKLDSLIEDN
ncbi:hypothetical protein DOY81_011668 [Sarcophaga bullata]|nr:hypothetical protein DOY81_011668 [Sarcophaga bullata]